MSKLSKTKRIISLSLITVILLSVFSAVGAGALDTPSDYADLYLYNNSFIVGGVLVQGANAKANIFVKIAARLAADGMDPSAIKIWYISLAGNRFTIYDVTDSYVLNDNTKINDPLNGQDITTGAGLAGAQNFFTAKLGDVNLKYDAVEGIIPIKPGNDEKPTYTVNANGDLEVTIKFAGLAAAADKSGALYAWSGSAWKRFEVSNSGSATIMAAEGIVPSAKFIYFTATSKWVNILDTTGSEGLKPSLDPASPSKSGDGNYNPFGSSGNDSNGWLFTGMTQAG